MKEYTHGRSRVTVEDNGSMMAFFPTWGFTTHLKAGSAISETLANARAELLRLSHGNPDAQPILAQMDGDISPQLELF